MVIWIQCHRCGHEWHTKSTAQRVTCPSCDGKVKNIRKDDLKKIIKNIIGI